MAVVILALVVLQAVLLVVLPLTRPRTEVLAAAELPAAAPDTSDALLEDLRTGKLSATDYEAASRPEDGA